MSIIGIHSVRNKAQLGIWTADYADVQQTYTNAQSTYKKHLYRKKNAFL